MPETFHVFLSHNSRDKPTVERIGKQLRDRGLRVWLDKWELRPGLPWQDEIEKGIDASNAVAVAIGADGLGPWEAPEMRAFIDRSRRETLPVIPVLLPGAPEKPELPIFLQAFTWVDLRDGMDQEGLDLLIWGITGRKPEDIAPDDVPGVHAPGLHNLPFPPLGNLFKGRDPVLAELAADLSAQPATAIVQPQALHGLGGIGKTRLAVEYAWRSGDRYDAVFFVRADTPRELSRGLALLARLRLPGSPELDGADEDSVVDAVLAWLRENRPWLLILDNVDSTDAAGAVRELLPRLSGGHVLVTSRLSRWPAGIRRRLIKELPTDDAVPFLHERTAEDRRQTADDAELASRLAKLLDGLPLALEQAGAYIAAHGIGFADYLAAWDAERSAVLEWHDKDEMSYPMPVAVTWQRTFTDLEPTSRALLRLCAHLAPDPIPVEMLTAGESIVAEAVNLVAEEASGVEEPIPTMAALNELVKYSLMTRRGESVSAHRMVQEVVRGRILTNRSDWIEKTVRLVESFAPHDADDVRTWPIWDQLRPHASRVIELAERAGVETLTPTLMSRLANLLYSKSLYSEAEPLIRRALAINEKSLGQDQPGVTMDLSSLAQLLQATNRLSEAEPLMRRALAIDEKSFGQEHPNVARDLNNLALLLKVTDRMPEAEPLMRRALAIDEKAFGQDHPKVAIRLNNLAQLLQETKRRPEAELLMRRALEIDEKSFEKEHPNVARDLNNLAQLLQDTDRLPEAELLMRRALAIDEKFFGQEHPTVATRLNNLAMLLKATNHLPEAKPLVRLALAIFTKRLGEGHPKTQMVQRNLDILLKAMEETDSEDDSHS